MSVITKKNGHIIVKGKTHKTAAEKYAKLMNFFSSNINWIIHDNEMMILGQLTAFSKKFIMLMRLSLIFTVVVLPFCLGWFITIFIILLGLFFFFWYPFNTFIILRDDKIEYYALTKETYQTLIKIYLDLADKIKITNDNKLISYSEGKYMNEIDLSYFADEDQQALINFICQKVTVELGAEVVTKGKLYVPESLTPENMHITNSINRKRNIVSNEIGKQKESTNVGRKFELEASNTPKTPKGRRLEL